VSDAPAYRIWPPVALGVPLLLALLWPSFWAVVLVPVGIAALQWGALLPEERYLSAKFGAEYDAYRHRTRRWC
jgi:protein-S-isoprenylcysteine O-methyltransferase Ste14